MAEEIVGNQCQHFLDTEDHMMKKRLLSLALVLALCFSFTSGALAANYTDIQNHWAKTYLETLVSKGILSGYEDGTMRPDNNITACETLALLSRLYTLTDSEKALIADDYEAEVKADVSASYSWAYGNLEICRAAGIITKDELKALSLGSELKKEELAVFIVRAMRYTTEASKLTVKDMTFKDAAKVSTACIGSVAELEKLGVLTGDNNKNVSPQSSVTRAVVATMVVRALDVLSDAGKTSLTIDAYSGAARKEGLVTAASASALTFTGLDGLTCEYAVSSAASVTLNGAAAALGSTLVGCHAVLSLKNNSVTALAVDSASDVKWYQGTITAVTASSASSFTLKQTQSGTSVSLACGAATSYSLDGAGAAVTKLAAGQFATVKVTGSTVSSVTALTNLASVSGTVTSVGYGTTMTLKLQDSAGAVYSYSFDFSALPTVTRGGKTVTIDRIAVGESVTLGFSGGTVAAIAVSGTTETVSGELTAITTTLNGTTWTITTSAGATATYTLDEDAGAYSGTTAINLSAIKVGDQVKVSVFGSVVTDVWQVTAVSSSTKVSGSVLKVDTAAKQITILTSANKLIYISTASVGSYVLASSGNTVTISSVALNAQITAYGSYSSARAFTAKSIVIE